MESTLVFSNINMPKAKEEFSNWTAGLYFDNTDFYFELTLETPKLYVENRW